VNPFQAIIKGLKTVAPKIAGALAGPAGSLVEGWLSDALNVNPNDRDALLAKVNNLTPQDVITLRQLEVEREKDLDRSISAAIEAAYVFESTQVKAQRDVIVAEAASKDWLPRNVRPMLLAGFGVIPIYHYALVPFLTLVSGVDIAPAETPHLDPAVWDALKWAMSGYIGARTAEKIVPSIANTFYNRGR
jgi:hypothetical protein